MGRAYQVLQQLSVRQVWKHLIGSCILADLARASKCIVQEKDMWMFYMVRRVQHHLGPNYPLYKMFPASKSQNRISSCSSLPFPDDMITGYGICWSYPRVHINRIGQDYVRDNMLGESGDVQKAWIVQMAEKHETVVKVCIRRPSTCFYLRTY